ncbi:DUF4097 family beta strand repeat-containing protein [Fodinibius halophilus]|uniref:DUF4097 domain-containing protein n=1 Tax=Fodinibius halophilus TaxID=1736908 RepID=A0A6M1THK5_9BACT|nr:DUF4097 family beta strand repeat-containing protein [Fodinibius halophilus]NGP90214.1 DUF4097 domain-containing protein [Fodinibius halophilus]
MKQRIKLLMAVLLVLATQIVSAQEYNHQLENIAENGVEFSLSRSGISVEGYEGNEVIIENKDYEAPPERAKGLRPLYGGGKDNTGIGLSIEEENGILKVAQVSSSGGDFVVRVPNKVRIMIEEVNWGGGDTQVKNHDGEIEIKSKTGDIKLVDITGPVIVSSTTGDADIIFTRVSNANPTSISLVGGYIDVTMPEATKADLEMKTLSGEIYTNMDLSLKDSKEKGMNLMGGGTVEGTLNGGGVDMTLKTISGEIYLRKEGS